MSYWSESKKEMCLLSCLPVRVCRTGTQMAKREARVSVPDSVECEVML